MLRRWLELAPPHRGQAGLPFPLRRPLDLLALRAPKDSSEIYSSPVGAFFASRQFAVFEVVGSALLFGLGLLNLIINTEHIGSWLGLILLMPLPFAQGVRQLRRSSARRTT